MADSKICLECGSAFHRKYREGIKYFLNRKYCSNRCSLKSIWRVIYFNEDNSCIISDRKHRARTLRSAYEKHIAKLSDDVELDHLCGNPKCSNLMHLEPVSKRENWNRFVASKTECKRGHLFSEENTYMRKNGRECKQCMRIRYIENRKRINGR